jgi:homoserine O-acetyltransferase/O-succinyltransferase
MKQPKTALILASVAVLLTALPSAQTPGQPNIPPVTEGDFVVRNYTFKSGETLPEVKLHYRTLGKLQKDASGRAANAVWIGHGTGGTGSTFLGRTFAGELFGPGQLLDATKYFIVIPDGVGHGASSKPSNGLRSKFPRYGYVDMIDLQYKLLTEGLGVNHMRLMMGTSMGGMHTWLWGELHPTFMDALMPLASVPGQISGRNRVWRRVLIDAIKNDPAWNGGNYTAQPPALRTAAQMLWLVSSNPLRRHNEAPTLDAADKAMESYIATYVKQNDANDVIYWFEASRDYDPGPGLEKIVAPLLAINTADDIVNPPEIGLLEKEIKRVKRGRAIVIPLSDQTNGHGTHTLAAVWKNYLAELLKESAR